MCYCKVFCYNDCSLTSAVANNVNELSICVQCVILAYIDVMAFFHIVLLSILSDYSLSLF